jgi:glycosyltransferase involved in cell wall biosynthesis
VDITVGICTWNRAESLRQTLDALTRLRLPPSRSWEVLVVNNNCSDHTDHVIRSFAGRLPLRRLHEPQPGKSLALNHAIREATGTYVLWTDDDVLVEPGWMAALVDGFERFQADWVFGRSRPLWVGGAPPWYSERFGGYFAVLDYGSEPRVITDRHEGFYGLNCAGTLIAHRHLGGFRAEFGFRESVGGIGAARPSRWSTSTGSAMCSPGKRSRGPA